MNFDPKRPGNHFKSTSEPGTNLIESRTFPSLDLCEFDDKRILETLFQQIILILSLFIVIVFRHRVSVIKPKTFYTILNVDCADVL